MPNFSLLGFLDPFDLLCSLKGRLGEFQGNPGLRVLHLRAARKAEPDIFLDTRDLTRWPEARAVLERIRVAARTNFKADLEWGRIWLEMLDAGSGTRPRRDPSLYAQRHLRLLCGLRCNPGAYLWCPPEQHVLRSGEIVATAPSLWHAAVNMGDFSRINLVIDAQITQPEPAFAPQAPEEILVH